MKGLTHFVAGVAVAACFPDAVRAGAEGNPLYFTLGGIFGLLPDTIDFKFVRFFSKHDMEVIPDPNNPDPQMIADAVAYAANKAFLTRQPVRIKLNTVRLGADRWQQYAVRFDVANRCVTVRYGPVVSTGQIPECDTAPEDRDVIAGKEPAKAPEASAPLACPITLDYQATTTIDIFDGPMFKMVPVEGGMVRPVFIPWHREWSHSVTVASLAALAGAALWGWLAGAVILGAYCAHIVADQMGFMGSNLFYPFGRGRTTGLGLMHSMESMPNFATIWFCCLLIFWHLYVAAPGKLPVFNLLQLLLFGGILPFLLVAAGKRLFGCRKPNE